jgi:integrase
MKAVKKFRNYVYGVRLLVETDGNTLVHQLNLPANDLPGALVTRWIAWIRLFNFDVKHVPGRLNGGPDGLSRWPRGEGEPEPEEEDDLEETIDASLRGIWVEQGSDRKRWVRPYEPFVGLRRAEAYKGRWKEIGEFLGNQQRPEGKTTEEMQQFRREATKYLVSDGILYWR